MKRLNADIAAAVTKAKKSGPKISPVNTYDAFFPAKYQPHTDTPRPFMADKLHPNETAGAPMAEVWFDAIRAAIVPHTSPK